MTDSRTDRARHEPLLSQNEHAQRLIMQAEALMEEHREAEALSWYEQACALDPANAFLHANRGNLLAELGRPDEALVAFDQALALAPNDPDLLMNKATILCTLGRCAKAIQLYSQMLACGGMSDDTLRAVALCNRGRAYLESDLSGKAASALADFEAALACLPSARMGDGSTLEQATALAQAGKQEAQALLTQINQMVEQNLGLVWSVVYRKHGLWEKHLEESDAFQEGVLGLIRAAEKYDPAKGAFSTYAMWWIKQFIARAAINQGRMVRLSASLWEALHRLLRLQLAFWHEQQRDPTNQELALALSCDTSFVQFLQELQAEVLSLDSPLPERHHEADDETLADIVSDEAADTAPYDQLGDRELIAQLLTYLTAEERKIIELRYHLVPLSWHGQGEEPYPRPYEDVGKALGLNRYQVVRKEDHAFLKMRYWAEQFRRREERRRREQNFPHPTRKDHRL